MLLANAGSSSPPHPLSFINSTQASPIESNLVLYIFLLLASVRCSFLSLFAVINQVLQLHNSNLRSFTSHVLVCTVPTSVFLSRFSKKKYIVDITSEDVRMALLASLIPIASLPSHYYASMMITLAFSQLTSP